MTIASTSSITTANTSSAAIGAGAAKTLDASSFITLLTAELKNQDPTKPMDPTQMVSQLATISSVQQAAKTNTLLASMLIINSLSQAEQLLGKSVTSADGTVSGLVASVTVGGSGSSAVLSDGSVVVIEDGLRVSAS